MIDEWKYLSSTRHYYINLAGEVRSDEGLVEPVEYRNTKHRAVELMLPSQEVYDYEASEWARVEETVLVWQLMKEAWFFSWPANSDLYFVDGNKWNCSADNIRVKSNETHKIIHVRTMPWGFVFDKRIRGNVKIVETGQVVSGPTEAAKVVGGTRFGVSKVLSGEMRRHKGYHFEWI